MYLERVDPGTLTWKTQGADHLSRYLFAIEFARGRAVLDAGTGSGYGAALLRASGATSMQAVDSDPAAIAMAAERFATAGIEFLVDDCEQFQKVRGSVDVICSFENIEHLGDPSAFLRAAARLLGEDGVLLCSTPDRRATSPFVDGRPANPYHVMEWHIEEFRTLLHQAFKSVDIRLQVQNYRLDLIGRALWSLRSQLRANPLWFVKRWLRGKRGREWEPLDWIGTPVPGDYPIVPECVADLFGVPFGQVAICRSPVR